MSAVESATPHRGDSNPFAAGPCAWLRTVLAFRRQGPRPAWQLALLTAFVAWAPLAVLAALQGLLLSAHPHESLLLDFSAYGRYVVAAPLLVFAGSVCLPKLGTTASQMLHSGFLPEHDQPRFLALVESTRRVLASRWTDALLLATAYAATLFLSPRLRPSNVTTWLAPSHGQVFHLSLAGWWATLVSQPLFLALLGAWLLRVMLWARLLWHVSLMDLQLVASHPDRLGGLRFLLGPVKVFTILAFALGAIGAGGVAEDVVVDGASLAASRYLIACQVMGAVVLFACPLLVLFKPLYALQAHGTVEYGRLASRLGHEFEHRWIAGRPAIDAQALAAEDFSATTDLYSIAANVRAINVFVLDAHPVIALAIATLLPYAPLVFTVMPFDQVMRLTIKAFV